MFRRHKPTEIATVIGALIIAVLIITLSVRSLFSEPAPTFTVSILQSYSDTPPTHQLLTEEEYVELHSTGVINYASYGDYVTSNSSNATMQTLTTSIHATGANAILYEMADEYFQVYYGSLRVSPILPMAISNVETPGRADHSVTWSSLFPTRYISIDEVNTFDVTQVIRNPELFKALSSEYSTRDRGCLQMSPTYGTGNKTVNERMSGTEKEKLSTADTSGYSTWVSGASDKPGDRFYLPDVLLRMQAAMQQQIVSILKNGYQPESELQLIAMLAMSHQSSGIWGNSNHSKSCGKWKSSEKCYEWSKVITTSPVVDKLIEYAATHDDCYIDTKTAESLFRSACGEQYSTYASSSAVCTYPIKCLYAYIKLCQLYTG